MTRRPPRSSAWRRAAVVTVTAAAGAGVGWFLGKALDPAANAFLLGAASLVFALANFAVPRVNSVFDQVLTDIQSLDEERIRRFETYVAAQRRRMLTSYFMSFVIVLLPVCAAGVIAGVKWLKDPAEPSDFLTVRVLCAVGYTGLSLFFIAIWRPLRLALAVNDFRQEVLDVARREKQRAAALAGRPPAIKRVSQETAAVG